MKEKTAISLIVVLTVFICLVLILGSLAYFKKTFGLSLSRVLSIQTIPTSIPRVPVRVQQFTYNRVSQMTLGFTTPSSDGRTCKVYHGRDGVKEVAVKVLGDFGHASEEFENEIHLLSSCQHQNILQFLGCCKENSKILISKYASSGSLDKCLFDPGSIPLNWRTRLNIIFDVAKGIQYLHNRTPPLVHRDIKSANILIHRTTDGYQAIIGDFGISMLLPDDGSMYVETDVKGTDGYIDPEYSKTKKLAISSDVYSFGILMLEILSGRRAIRRRPTTVTIIEWVRSLEANDPQLERLLDPVIRQQRCCWLTYQSFLTRAMKCVNEEANLRPSMDDLVRELETSLYIMESQRFRDFTTYPEEFQSTQAWNNPE